ncbi:FecCD family ABC transporter permease [Streptococcus suis]|uniref:FecCD family ABC transporter permease n=1 Tax=Streptococcus suis TaxID=1307 RepID=UPI000CF5F790|nr:iron ABC transporter permease [Streptococcus suis]MBM7312525.1 iron ABC transporter permease [Streptococcus suis]MBM7318645.1 iron ABC transporter permease [Streptococcus suis]MBY4964256.1 iron ABC transporter permease [Streptococcus suis]TII09923.1 iron ABC transporter permease [Streptococcus suis]HEM6071951.1 iron ABC transporter permease [Streptococcus suis]
MNKLASSHYPKTKPKNIWLVFFIISLLFVIGAYLSLRFGAISYSHQQLVETLRHPMTDSPVQDVVIDLRLPRMVAAILVGAAMAQAGAMMQGITRNPIADPGLLGINAGAGLALIVAYALFGGLHYSQILLICLLGSCLAAGLVFGLAYQVQKGYNQLRLILSGAMVASLFSAIGQAITIYFDLSTAVIGWQAGGLVQVNWKMLAIIAPLIIIGLILAQLFSHQLTILSLNETVAKNLGQRTLLMTLILLGIVLLLSASAVALVGSLSFVGLIIPHFIRMFTGKNYKLLLPLTAFAGASFLIWVDLVCRSINPPVETPISAVISIIGLPCFLWLIRKEKHF